MLVPDIVRRVREATGDLAVLQYAETTVTDWINDAVRLAVEENSLLQVRGTAATVAATQEYTLPLDLLKIHSIYVDNIKIPIITLSEWEDAGLNTPSTGTPTVGSIYAGKLALSPTPTRVHVLTLNYSRNPTDIVYNSVGPVWIPNVPSIPDAFHSRIVTYCIAQVALQDDDYAKYQAFMIEFKTGVLELKGLRDETENLYPFMHYVDREMEL